MLFESSVTTVSWIPSESVSGMYKAGFAVGASHPDDPSPDVIEGPAKFGRADFRQWMATAYGWHSPWGHEDSQPLVTVAESALERQLSATIMHGGAKPAIGKLAAGALLAEQGGPGGDICLLLDGVLSVWVDGTQVAELGPGAVVGERALLEDGRRTATLRAVTDCIIATAADVQINRESLASLAGMRHREDSDDMSRQVDDAAEPTGDVCTAGMVRAVSLAGTPDASTARRGSR